MNHSDQAASDDNGCTNPGALAMFDAKLNALAQSESDVIGRKNMWLAHHWPEHYEERCVLIARHQICRRCAALYPLGLLVALLSTVGLVPWPGSIDPYAIWILSIPATLAYCAEALGLIQYSPKVQVSTTLLAALAFGRALGYEFQQRGSSQFWGPIVVFGLIWFVFTAIGMRRR